MNKVHLKKREQLRMPGRLRPVMALLATAMLASCAGEGPVVMKRSPEAVAADAAAMRRLAGDTTETTAGLWPAPGYTPYPYPLPDPHRGRVDTPLLAAASPTSENPALQTAAQPQPAARAPVVAAVEPVPVPRDATVLREVPPELRQALAAVAPNPVSAGTPVPPAAVREEPATLAQAPSVAPMPPSTQAAVRQATPVLQATVVSPAARVTPAAPAVALESSPARMAQVPAPARWLPPAQALRDDAPSTLAQSRPAAPVRDPAADTVAHAPAPSWAMSADGPMVQSVASAAVMRTASMTAAVQPAPTGGLWASLVNLFRREPNPTAAPVLAQQSVPLQVASSVQQPDALRNRSPSRPLVATPAVKRSSMGSDRPVAHAQTKVVAARPARALAKAPPSKAVVQARAGTHSTVVQAKARTQPARNLQASAQRARPLQAGATARPTMQAEIRAVPGRVAPAAPAVLPTMVSAQG